MMNNILVHFNSLIEFEFQGEVVAFSCKNNQQLPGMGLCVCVCVCVHEEGYDTSLKQDYSPQEMKASKQKVQRLTPQNQNKNKYLLHPTEGKTTTECMHTSLGWKNH